MNTGDLWNSFMHKESLFTKNRKRPSLDKLTPYSNAMTGAPTLLPCKTSHGEISAKMHLILDKIGHSTGGVGWEKDQYWNYMEIYQKYIGYIWKIYCKHIGNILEIYFDPVQVRWDGVGWGRRNIWKSKVRCQKLWQRFYVCIEIFGHLLLAKGKCICKENFKWHEVKWNCRQRGGEGVKMWSIWLAGEIESTGVAAGLE